MKLLSKTDKIGWFIHTYGPIDPVVYFNHMSNIMKWSSQYKMAFLGIDKYRAADARNMLVDSAKSLKCTHILIVDSDHILPDHTLECLQRNKDADIVSGLICKRKPPYEQVGFCKDDEGEYYAVDLAIDGRSYLVDMPAMGCTLIDMSVFDKLEKPYFEDVTATRANGDKWSKRSDSRFFDLVKDAGVKCIIDSRVLVGHVGSPNIIYPNNVPDTKKMNQDDRIWDNSMATKYQAPVYGRANSIADSIDKCQLLDLGCGNPQKLKPFRVSNITGIDFPSKILDIAAGGIKGNWLGRDLNEEFNLDYHYDLIIAADVIEHVDNTDVFFTNVNNHAKEGTFLVLSSPEKTSVKRHNPLHVREFMKEELKGIITANGWSIEDFFQYTEDTGKTEYTNNVFIGRK
jgi:2-polyprenyl-3-methyl-5-hydroxy-6-metoxy-1,4-benzoquinol methylase